MGNYGCPGIRLRGQRADTQFNLQTPVFMKLWGSLFFLTDPVRLTDPFSSIPI